MPLADMVGHTGDLQATADAVTLVDKCLGELLDTVEKLGGRCAVCSGFLKRLFMYGGGLLTRSKPHQHMRCLCCFCLFWASCRSRCARVSKPGAQLFTPLKAGSDIGKGNFTLCRVMQLI